MGPGVATRDGELSFLCPLRMQSHGENGPSSGGGGLAIVTSFFFV